MRKILFVCTGNTCRSPMAQGFFNKIATGDPQLKGHFEAVSAGTAAHEGEPASPYSRKVMAEDWGIDISGHCAHNISMEDIKTSFLIITMTASHKNTLIARFPQALDKTFTLREFISGTASCGPENKDITDPYGGPEIIYRECARQIRQGILCLIEKIKSDNKSGL